MDCACSPASRLTCAAASLAERVERGLGFGGPVGGAGAERAGGQRLAQVVGAHLLRVVGGRLTPVCNTKTANQHHLPALDVPAASGRFQASKIKRGLSS